MSTLLTDLSRFFFLLYFCGCLVGLLRLGCCAGAGRNVAGGVDPEGITERPLGRFWVSLSMTSATGP